jgi:2-C-methyl-D-erythritol 2,4-cyclodiphosphate synthase
MKLRIGQGFDVHAFAPGRPLILAGVEIPFSKGLQGHSDADVMLHALIDALLGAAALGDIGEHFSDQDPKFKNIDSRIMLRHTGELIKKAGWEIQNIDLILMAQAPKISSFKFLMQQNLSADLLLDLSQINIKATTTEQLGFVGREEGMACSAIALLQSI